MSNVPHNDNALNATARFCPACGSALVDASSLSGGEASCGTCTWKGKLEELVAVPFGQDVGSADDMVRLLFLDIRKFLSKDFTPPFLQLLVKWGFLLHRPIQAPEVARYMGAVSKAIALALIEERGKIEKERTA